MEQRPWGYFEVLSDTPDHKVKRITVYPGKRMSLQSHGKRDEHWYLLAGSAVVTIDGRQQRVGKTDSVNIPRGTPHRILNAGSDDVIFIEVQTGEYFGEDDIERIEDDFGRV